VVSGVEVWKGGRDEWWSPGDFSGSKTILNDITMVVRDMYSPETHRNG
jgi:hypothetical protein